jgi:hypothetical protein
MKQKTINLYTFEELTPEQQEKVLNNNRFINDDDFELYVGDEFCMGEIWESGFINAQSHYSLSYSQGDGACFDCNEFDFDKLLKDWEHPHKNWIVNIIKKHCYGYIKSNSWACRYSHEKTRYFELVGEGDLDYNYEHIDKALDLAEQHIEALRLELSENLTARLYEQLEWLRSDEQIKDTLIANDCYFNEETLEIEY